MDNSPDDFLTKSTGRILASLSVISCVLIFAAQDVWVANLERDSDPLLLVFWIFLGVAGIAAIIALLKRESLILNRKTVFPLLVFNLTTAISWLFTFMALSRVSPNVVSAFTLSMPPLLIMISLDRKKRLSRGTICALILLIFGLFFGLCAKGEKISFDLIGLIYCLLASLGVVGKSVCMRSLNRLGCKGNSVLAARFFGLLGTLAGYYLFTRQSIPMPRQSVVTIGALTLVTTYLPLLILYYSHRHLSIYSINLGLALTPIATVLFVALLSGLDSIDNLQRLSIILVFVAVTLEFKNGAVNE